MTISKKQLALLRVAKGQLGLDEDAYRSLLRSAGGVESARDLDAGGFAFIMYRFEEMGFRSTTAKRSFGVRPGMPSPRQVAFIRRLWAEWSDAGDDDAALNRWLEHHFHVSALRFLDDAGAQKAISALKAMNARKAEKAGEAEAAPQATTGAPDAFAAALPRSKPV